MKLPPGFPVKIDIPILPTVTAKITFQEFAFRHDIDPQLFQIPTDYSEDRSYEVNLERFPHTFSYNAIHLFNSILFRLIRFSDS